MKINKKTLDNGLRLVHHEDAGTQMVALNIVYDVGARDEHPEHTGFAHLFEHLMFGGSVHIPDYDTPLQLAGGENNAWTNNDITNYYLTVPKSNVETAFWLESDRMLELAFSEQSLDVQRGVVMEEFKQRCLNQPYGDVGHLLRPLAYRVHPYRWPTIGKELSHIAGATLDEVKSFFYRFYAPNNAVLAVTGNISWTETLRLADKWFAPIPRRNVTARQLPQEPPQTEERRRTVERNVPLDALFMAYPMCGREGADYYAFDILSDILSNGRSSRLNRKLVQEQKLFSALDAYISGTRDAGLLHISGKPSAGITLEQAEAAVRKELEVLKRELVGEQELEKVKNKFESSHIFGNINYLNVATNLAWFELTGQAEDIDREVDNYRSVTAEHIHAVAQNTFRDANTVVLYYKKASGSYLPEKE
ncbi:M16 family metallopeptidase [Bacteroides heparinolyticus]|uniref:M16 family metallopeptidase n=1 Tax=Prevotella heparinolytica TaxID=28113 RepID=UPI0035A144A7